MGKSGAGKSTLLYQVSLLDRPDSGEIIIDGTDVLSLNSRNRTAFRLYNLGYIFQDYALLPELTAIENVMVPLLMLGQSWKEAYQNAYEVFDTFSLCHRINNLPTQLSGGEQQRVSVARAVAQKPSIIFADEPTANLDSSSSWSVLKLMQKLNKTTNITIVMITHEKEYAKISDRIITLEDGCVKKSQNIRKKK